MQLEIMQVYLFPLNSEHEYTDERGVERQNSPDQSLTTPDTTEQNMIL